MDALTQLVLVVTLAAVVLYALYGVVRKAIRDELAARGGHDERTDAPPSES